MDKKNAQNGKLFVVGIGPGGKEQRTLEAVAAIEKSDLISGYKKYLNNISDLTKNKETFTTGMGKEVERVEKAVIEAEGGRIVSLISSGDAGIYGMAGLALEIAGKRSSNIDIEIVAGVTAASAAAAALGAPLMLDFVCISLSDILVPWEKIEYRLEKAAESGMVTVLYNPRSKKRVTHLERAVEIFKKHRDSAVYTGIVTEAGTDHTKTVITTLGEVLEKEVDMHSVVVITNEETILIDDKLIMPRGYKL
ncbi:MAG: precorrin-3B C(17)-methyltransferase [Planctomycetota bacterium]|jgi:precorrin-3B C17-methyltransferase